MRVWPAADYTRRDASESDAAAGWHQPQNFDAPWPGGRHRRPEAEPDAARAGRQGASRDDPFIGGVRVVQNQPAWCAWWWSSSSRPRPRCSTLEPVAAYGHRRWCSTSTPDAAGATPAGSRSATRTSGPSAPAARAGPPTRRHSLGETDAPRARRPVARCHPQPGRPAGRRTAARGRDRAA